MDGPISHLLAFAKWLMSVQVIWMPNLYADATCIGQTAR
jgi:hypothetical protein